MSKNYLKSTWPEGTSEVLSSHYICASGGGKLFTFHYFPHKSLDFKWNQTWQKVTWVMLNIFTGILSDFGMSTWSQGSIMLSL
jgi:hypothetical protein